VRFFAEFILSRDTFFDRLRMSGMKSVMGGIMSLMSGMGGIMSLMSGIKSVLGGIISLTSGMKSLMKTRRAQRDKGNS